MVEEGRKALLLLELLVVLEVEELMRMVRVGQEIRPVLLQFKVIEVETLMMILLEMQQQEVEVVLVQQEGMHHKQQLGVVSVMGEQEKIILWE